MLLLWHVSGREPHTCVGYDFEGKRGKYKRRRLAVLIYQSLPLRSCAKCDSDKAAVDFIQVQVSICMHIVPAGFRSSSHRHVIQITDAHPGTHHRLTLSQPQGDPALAQDHCRMSPSLSRSAISSQLNSQPHRCPSPEQRLCRESSMSCSAQGFGAEDHVRMGRGVQSRVRETA